MRPGPVREWPLKPACVRYQQLRPVRERDPELSRGDVGLAAVGFAGLAIVVAVWAGWL